MKWFVAFAVATSLLFGTSVAWSQERKPQPEQRRGAKPAMNARIDGQINKLRTLHERLTASTATPAERQSAMDDARKEMQASITMMQRGGPSAEANPAGDDELEEMMPGRKGGGSGSGRGQGTAKRLEMMLMMIQLIVDQQALLAIPTTGDAASRKTGTTAKSANKSAKASDAATKK
jgi:hypothetical protein